jgi:flagellar hook-basal body complex protein FliE
MELSAITGLSQTLGQAAGQNSGGSAIDGTQMFGDVLKQLIDNTNSTDAALQADIIKAAEGELDNPHQLLIDMQKATIALQLTTSVRNEALSAYNDIIRLSL